ncbi:ligand-binding sensor domain-containing protein [Mucilaginibacter terrae]|nr:two-component regulator propeller domain-containing protein [Mucilaginibacter terrae]
MKKFIYLLMIPVLLLSLSCKKSNIHPPKTSEEELPQPGNSNFPEWVTYDHASSPLPNDQVNAIAIGKNNVKWMGTAEGLARLEGTQWTIYNTGNSPLPSNHIQALTVEDNGTVWVGTPDGLARFNGTNWNVYTTANSLLTNNGIKCMAYDAGRNTVWAGTEEGIIKITNGNWQYIDHFETILSMAVDHNGALWMGEFKGFSFVGVIKKYQNGQWTSYRLDQLGYASAFAYSIAVDKNDRIVAALAGTVVKAVIRFDGNHWEEVTRPEQARGFRAMVIQNDKIWVGGATFTLYGDRKSPVIAIPGTNSPVLSMALDANGRKWLGTYDGGVAVYR